MGIYTNFLFEKDLPPYKQTRKHVFTVSVDNIDFTVTVKPSHLMISDVYNGDNHEKRYIFDEPLSGNKTRYDMYDAAQNYLTVDEVLKTYDPGGEWDPIDTRPMVKEDVKPMTDKEEKSRLKFIECAYKILDNDRIIEDIVRFAPKKKDGTFNKKERTRIYTSGIVHPDFYIFSVFGIAKSDTEMEIKANWIDFEKEIEYIDSDYLSVNPSALDIVIKQIDITHSKADHVADNFVPIKKSATESVKHDEIPSLKDSVLENSKVKIDSYSRNKEKEAPVKATEIKGNNKKETGVSKTPVSSAKDTDIKKTENYDKLSSSKKDSIQVGKKFTFGSYPQTADGKDKTPIEWRVLDIKDNKALIITDRAIDNQPYNTIKTDVTWETCSLRFWLNNSFLNTAFSAEEQLQICNTKVPADKNTMWIISKTKPGKSTIDKIFLLSIKEVKKYFPSPVSRKCKATRYFWSSKSRDVEWSLRTPGVEQNCNSLVVPWTGDDGICDFFSVDFAHAIRPAIWINLKKKNKTIKK